MFRRLKRTVVRWQRDDGNLLAASVAYYMAFSFFPILLILIAGIGFFLQSTALGRTAEEEIFETLGDYVAPTLAEQVQVTLSQVQREAVVGGPVGLVTLLVATGAIFTQIQFAFDRIWKVDDPSSRGVLGGLKSILFYRLKAFLMLLGIGLVIVMLFAAGLAFAAVRAHLPTAITIPPFLAWAGQMLVSVLVDTLLFGLLYWTLPKALVAWSTAWRGGAFAAIVWEVGRQGLAAFLIGKRYASAYGVVGSFIAVMLWVYFSSAVLFLGAEYVRTVQEERAEGGGETP